MAPLVFPSRQPTSTMNYQVTLLEVVISALPRDEQSVSVLRDHPFPSSYHRMSISSLSMNRFNT